MFANLKQSLDETNFNFAISDSEYAMYRFLGNHDYFNRQFLHVFEKSLVTKIVFLDL